MKKNRKKMLKIMSLFILFLTCINGVKADSNFKIEYGKDLYARCNENNKCIPICIYNANSDDLEDDSATNGEIAYVGYYYSGKSEWEIGFEMLNNMDGWITVYSNSTILPTTDIYWSNFRDIEKEKQLTWNKATEESTDGQTLWKPYDKLKNDFKCPDFITRDKSNSLGTSEMCFSNKSGTCKKQNDLFFTHFEDDRPLKSSFAEDVGNVINDTYNNLYIFTSPNPAGADPDSDKKLKFLADVDKDFNKKYNPAKPTRDNAIEYCSILEEKLKDEEKYFNSLGNEQAYRNIIDRQLQVSAQSLNVRNKEVYTDETLSSLLTITDSSGNKKYRQITDPTGQTYIEKLHSIYGQNIRTSLNYVKDMCNTLPDKNIEYDEQKLVDTVKTKYETTVYKNIKLDTDSQFSCGTLGDLADLVKTGYFIIEMVALVILVVFTVLDYAKVILSGEQDEMKKTNKRLATRLIIMVVLLLLPALINFVLGVFNIEGFNSENPLCVEIKNR